MPNEYYNPSGAPATRSAGSSAQIRNEFALITAGLDKLPTMSGNQLQIIRVNAAGNALEAIAASASDFVLRAGDTMTGSLTAPGFVGPLAGNASTATALQTARTINGVAFNGTSNITVTASAGTLTGSTLAAGVTASSLTSLGTLTALTVAGLAAFNGGVTLGDGSSDALTINSNTATIPNGLTLSSGNFAVGPAGTAATDSVVLRNAQAAQLGLYRDLNVGTSGAAATIISMGALDGTTQTAGAQIAGVLNNPATTGYLAFYTRNSGALTERVRISELGNVGIGTNSDPVARLRVDANDPTRGILGIFRNALNTTGAQIQISQSGVSDWAFGQPGGVNALAFWSGRTTGADGSERMRLDSSGNLGIGTTAAAGTRLDIRDNTGSDLMAQVKNNGAGRAMLVLDAGGTSQSVVRFSQAGVSKWLILSNGGTSLDFADQTAGLVRATINAAGRLILNRTTDSGLGVLQVAGGGDFSPASGNASLYIRSVVGSNAALEISSHGAAAGDGISLIQDNSYIGYLYNRQNASLVFGTNNSAQMTLSAAGALTPQNDASQNFGGATNRWGTAFVNAVSFGTNSTALDSSGATIRVGMGSAWTTVALSTGGTDRLTVSNAGVVNMTAGSGSLRLNGAVTRAELTATPASINATSTLAGLPRQPDSVTVWLECLTAEAGYSVGEYYQWMPTGVGLTGGYRIYMNAAGDSISIQRPNTTIQIPDKGTGTATNITPANWRIRVRMLWL